MTPQLDELAHSLEMKWGADRLPRLVKPETAARFQHWADKLNAAIEAGADNVAELAGIVERGWRAMDKEATEWGCAPMPPACFSVKVDGHIIEIAQDQPHATALMWWAKNEGRTVAVWTLEEVATVLRLHGVAHQAKEVWPGALVTALPAPMREGKRRMDVADEIPFPNPDAEDAA
jgi:glycerophosphoryl diester phosphodiesterase